MADENIVDFIDKSLKAIDKSLKALVDLAKTQNKMIDNLARRIEKLEEQK